MEYICPICQVVCTLEPKEVYAAQKHQAFQDYACRPTDDKHMYIVRVKSDTIEQFKFRLTEPDNSRIICKVMYNQSAMEVWEVNIAGVPSERIRIPQIPEFDESFSIEKIRNKIKTYFLFS